MVSGRLLLADKRHSIPTRWGLYRPLLYLSRPWPLLTSEVKRLFRKHSLLSRVDRVQIKLNEAYELHADLVGAATGNDFRLRRVQERASFLELRQSHYEAQKIVKDKLKQAQEDRLRRKPVLMPSVIRGTRFHPPMQRLRPQPPQTSMMIRDRILRYQHLVETTESLKVLREHALQEQQFLQRLGIKQDWTSELNAAAKRVAAGRQKYSKREVVRF